MTTLLTTIFYLWLVITILLAAMWFLRRQDKLREDQPAEDVLLPAAEAPLSEAAKNGKHERLQTDQTSDAARETEPEPETEPETSEIEPETVSEAAAEDESETASDAVADSEPNSDSEAQVEPDAEPANDESEEDVTATVEPESTSNEPVSANAEPVEDPVDPDPEEDSESEDTASEDTASEEAVDAEVAETNGSGPVGETAEPTVEQLLDGITLPFDLAPMPTALPEPSRHAVFLSSHPDPEEVGTAFADRLVELGFEIEPAGFDQAHAIRDGQVLSLRIAADAGNNGDAGRYPDADKGDVAIEVWTGDGPPPPVDS